MKDLRTEARTLDGVAGLFPPGRATIGGGVGQPEQARVLAAGILVIRSVSSAGLSQPIVKQSRTSCARAYCSASSRLPRS